MTSARTPALPPIEHALLLLIDLQRLFVAPESPARVEGWPAAREAASRLVAAFTARGWPVLRTRHVHPPGDDGGTLGHLFPRLLRADDAWAALAEGAVGGADATPVVDKARLSALSVPQIEAAARAAGVLVLAGVHTHRCVLATAVDAARLGLRPVVVSDACAARSPAQHQAALAVLADGHAHVADTDHVLAALAEGVP